MAASSLVFGPSITAIARVFWATAISASATGLNCEKPGAIRMRDFISAPRCFEIERRLSERLDVPVFHDDQHGTAVVVLAALRNALRVVGKELEDVRIVLVGAGAAGTAVLKVVLAGARHVVVCDADGVVHVERDDLHPSLRWTAENTNADALSGALSDVIPGADVFIGVSAPNILSAADVESMNDDAIVFALANPDPEIDPAVARRHARVVATGRSDHPNQINNVLAFPGIFRGLLDAQAHGVDPSVLLAASEAIAASVTDDELNENYVIPSVFHHDVHDRVAAAVRQAAERAAREHPIDVPGEAHEILVQ